MMPDIFSKEIRDVRQSARNTDELDTAAQTIRSIVQLVIIGLLIGTLLQDVKLPTTLLGLCVILLLWLVVRTNATPLLVALQMVLFFHVSGRMGGESGFGSIVYVAVALGLLTFLSRDRSLQKLINRSFPDLIKSFFKKPEAVAKPILLAADQPPVVLRNRQSTSLVRQIAMLLVCVLLSQLLLNAFAISGGVTDGHRSRPDAETLLGKVSPLLLITLVAIIVTSELAWRRLTVGQASMYLRSTQVTLLHADIRMIVKGRLKFLRRQKKTPTIPSPPSETVDPIPAVHDLRK